MKTKTLAATALIAILLAVVAATAFASAGHSADPMARGNDNSQGDHNDRGHMAMACNNLTAGENITVSGLIGHYANATDQEMHGNASGTFTFKVGTIYSEGCTLSLTGGSFTLNATTYTVTGGTLVLNHGGRSGTGTGTTSGGSSLIAFSGLHGNSTSTNIGAVRLDFMTGTSQFLVHLHSQSPEGYADVDADAG